MPIEKLPLFGNVAYSAIPGSVGGADRIPLKSQLFRNCIISTRGDPFSRSFVAKSEKRPGLTQEIQVSSGSLAIADMIVPSWGGGLVYVAGQQSTYQVSLADAATTLGQLSSTSDYLSEFDISGVGHLGVNSASGYAGYWRTDQIDTPTTFTGNTTNGSAVVTNIASTAAYLVGQGLSGSQMGSGARIQSIDSATQITMTVVATGTATPATITRQPLAQIIDADYPQSTAVGRFAYMDGYAFIMTSTGRIYNSDLNSITSWNASNYLTANAFPDGGVGLLRYKDRIVAFGKISTEFFTNAGNASGSVLLGSSGANIKIGAVSAKAITGVDDTVAWIGLSQQGGVGVYMLDGFSPVKISTDDVEAFLNSVGAVSGASLRASYIAGRRYLFLALGQVSSTVPAFVYDLEGKQWMQWHSGNVTNAFQVVVYDPFEGNTRVAAGVDYIYRIVYGASTVFTDNASAISAVIQLGPWDAKTGNRKTVNYYELQCDQQTSGTPTALLEASDNDGQTWATIGTFDLLQKNPRLYRGGSFTRGRMHRVTAGGTNSFGASYLAVDYRVGVH